MGEYEVSQVSRYTDGYIPEADGGTILSGRFEKASGVHGLYGF
jgi:hypothetical protein